MADIRPIKERPEWYEVYMPKIDVQIQFENQIKKHTLSELSTALLYYHENGDSWSGNSFGPCFDTIWEALIVSHVLARKLHGGEC